MANPVKPTKQPPQYAIPKSEGDTPVQAWIDLLPGWMPAAARRVDAVVVHELPNVHKAVKWHGVWYGVPGRGWILAIHAFKAHLKLTFFDGLSLTPIPPDALKQKPARALNLRETATLDEARLADWIRQASRLPGWGNA